MFQNAGNSTLRENQQFIRNNKFNDYSKTP